MVKKNDIYRNFLVNKRLLLQRGKKAFEDQRAQGARDIELNSQMERISG